MRPLLIVVWMGLTACTDRSLNIGFLAQQSYEVQLYTAQNPTNQLTDIPVSLAIPAGADVSVLGAHSFEVENGSLASDVQCSQTLCTFKVSATPLSGVTSADVKVTFKETTLNISLGSLSAPYVVSAKTLTIRVETAAPTITSVVVNNSQSWASSTVLPYQVIGDRINDVRISDDDTCASGTWSATTGFVTISDVEGVRTLYVQARDLAGNLGSCVAATPFTLDLQVPQLVVGSPTPTLGTESSVFSWTVQASDQNGVEFDVTKVSVLGAASGCQVSLLGAGDVRTVEVTGCTASGDVSLQLGTGFLKDPAGNNAGVQTTDFVMVDNVQPVVAITSPAELQVVANQFSPFTVTGTCNKEGMLVTFSHPVVSSVTCAGGAWVAQVNFASVNSYLVSLQATLVDGLGRISASNRLFSLPDIKIYSNISTFAALKPGGKIIAWGDSLTGGLGGSPDPAGGYRSIASTTSAFAALRHDGAVLLWGNASNGGTNNTGVNLSQVTSIVGTQGAFAAIRSDQSVVAWGASGYGGTSPVGLTGVEKLFANSGAFAALKTDGSVVTWGGSGGNSSAVAAQLSWGVVDIAKNDFAFTALKADGSVVTWGAANYIANFVAPSDVRKVFGNNLAFVALKNDSSVYAWGGGLAGEYGGVAPSELSVGSAGVVDIIGSYGAFAALRANGTVTAWGHTDFGGSAPMAVSMAGVGIISVVSNYYGFTAIKADGSVISWGGTDCGDNCGSVAPAIVTDTASVGFVPVQKVYSNRYAMAALREDGSVITWGHASYGGSSSSASAQISSGVKEIYSTDKAFAAVKSDMSVVTWGLSSYGGDSSAVGVSLNP